MPVTPLWWFIAIYSLLLLLLGWLAGRSSRESSLKDYYLAGGALGPIALFFTLFATNYSGGSLFAVPGRAYSAGLQVLPLMLGLTGVGVILLLYAPRLYVIAREQRFITLGDFIHWRYRYRPLFWLVNALAVFSLVAYMLTNLLAVGLLLETASNGAVSFAVGVIAVALIMACYESLGGMRSVVWTDILQGTLLLAGALLAVGLTFFYEPLAVSSLEIQLAAQWQLLQAGEFPLVNFLSLTVVTMFAACVYPQKIQRIYAARSLRTTRQAYWVMLFMPVVTLLPLTLVSMSAAGWIEGLSGRDTERIMLYVIASLDQHISWAPLLLTVYLAAGIAAIMSTIDSALLTLGSMVTNDVIRTRWPALSQAGLQRIGKLLAWVLMAVMVVAAILLPQSVWSVLVLMLEVMLQLAPAVLLGVWWRSVSGPAMFAGLLAGLSLTLMLKVAGQTPLTLHAGLWGVMLNLVVVLLCQSCIAVLGTRWSGAQADQQ